MNITYTNIRQNENDQTVYWTLNDGINDYQWWSDIPKNVDVQSYLESKMNEYLILIRKREYPDAPINQEDFDFDQWIKDGCIIPAIYSKDDKGNKILVKSEFKAKKKEWVIVHPTKERIIDGEKLSAQTLEEFNSASSVKRLKEVLLTVLQGRK